MCYESKIDHLESKTAMKREGVRRTNAEIISGCFSWLTARRLVLAAIPWFAMTGCIAEEAGLDGTWQLKAIDQTPIEASPEDQAPFFKVAGDTIEGFDGCNRFSGSIDRPGAISATRRGCLDVKNMLPMDLNELDAHFRSAEINGDTMTVPARGDYPESTYARKNE